MSKILITSGCSFTETTSGVINTWPMCLFDELSKNHSYVEHKSGGLGSQGNGLISRKVMYFVSEALKKYKPEDITVGIMWSGPNRVDFRCTDPSLLQFNIDGVDNQWMENPTRFVEGSTKNWVILNHHWASIKAPVINEEAKLYYKYFYDDVGATISTFEHMLRVQWFLERYNVRYFFSTYQDYVLTKNPWREHKEVKHLYDMIDFKNFLPVKSMGNWVENSSVYGTADIHEGDHPSSRQHHEFTEKVILPWVKYKKII